MDTGSIPIRERIRIDKVMVDQVLDRRLEKHIISEVDDTIADEQTPKFDLLIGGCGRIEVVMVDPEGEVGDVFACVGLACDPEDIAPIF